MAVDYSKKIVVVCGGTSTEREISLRSGDGVYNALLEAGFKNVALFDLKADNLGQLLRSDIDLAFLTLHGKGGEDGCIQGALELAGIPYTGSGVLASAVCMDKCATKRMLSTFGIPTAPFLTFSGLSAGDSYEQLKADLVSKIGLPMVLKSPCQGSSIGVVIVKTASELDGAIDEVLRYGSDLLAEKFISGVELTLPVVGNGDPFALPIIEITSEREFYDFTAKYTQGLCHHIIPARISEATAAAVTAIGIDTYKRLGCKGFARVDFLVDPELGPLVMEVNTLPGMTGMSLVPDAAAAAGISYPELVTRIVSLSL